MLKRSVDNNEKEKSLEIYIGGLIIFRALFLYFFFRALTGKSNLDQK